MYAVSPKDLFKSPLSPLSLGTSVPSRYNGCTSSDSGSCAGNVVNMGTLGAGRNKSEKEIVNEVIYRIPQYL